MTCFKIFRKHVWISTIPVFKGKEQTVYLSPFFDKDGARVRDFGIFDQLSAGYRKNLTYRSATGPGFSAFESISAARRYSQILPRVHEHLEAMRPLVIVEVELNEHKFARFATGYTRTTVFGEFEMVVGNSMKIIRETELVPAIQDGVRLEEHQRVFDLIS